MKTKWVRLVLGDDWGHKFYKEKGHYGDYGTHSISDQGINLLGLKEIDVRFARGSKARTVKLTMKTFHEHVSDHGHSYSASSSVPVAKVKIQGIKLELSLDKFYQVAVPVDRLRK